MHCIYCREPSDGTTSEAHIVPEAIAQNGHVLPLGTVCDDCNHALGDLDRTVAQHPFIAFPIQFLNIPGKRDRLRDRVGNVDRTVHHGGITVPCSPPGVEADLVRGTTSHRVRILVDPNFDFWKFRRGLYHIAFNYLASWKGAEHVLGSAYDATRLFVRRPPRGRADNYPFAQVNPPRLDQLRRIVQASGEEGPTGEIIGLHFFDSNFFVCPKAPSDIVPWAKANLPAHAHVFDESYVVPEDAVARPTPERYRVTIEPKSSTAVIAHEKSTVTARNDPCPCGSGQKFKRCHGRREDAAPEEAVE